MFQQDREGNMTAAIAMIWDGHVGMTAAEVLVGNCTL